MAEPIQPAFSAEHENVDSGPLSQQLGSADELTTLSPIGCSHQLTKIHSLPALRGFLLRYQQEVLGPREFRHIFNASNYASQNFVRELLALDKQVAGEEAFQEFQLASRHVGKRQLNRLRAMKDLRLVQRYRGE